MDRKQCACTMDQKTSLSVTEKFLPVVQTSKKAILLLVSIRTNERRCSKWATWNLKLKQIWVHSLSEDDQLNVFSGNTSGFAHLRQLIRLIWGNLVSSSPTGIFLEVRENWRTRRNPDKLYKTQHSTTDPGAVRYQCYLLHRQAMWIKMMLLPSTNYSMKAFHYILEHGFQDLPIQQNLVRSLHSDLFQ